MKRFMTLLVAGFLIAGLVGCATTTERKTYRTLKSPAIGFQYDAPVHHN
ncbi:hypothetical protein [Geoalkalibacter sp.]|nr:hypothetical protein [Geoalkalibacter sp.]